MNTNRYRFRVWDIAGKRYIPDYVGTFADLPVTIEGIVLEQCTGLKDKDGRLIYEGDIILGEDMADPHINNYGVGYVEWDDITAQFVVVADDECLTFDSIGSSIEVVGNVHENRSLLEA